MSNEIQIFRNEEINAEIRGKMIDGEPWFVGKDVATALGYSNTNDAPAKHVEEDDKKDGVAFRDAIGREQKMIVINESGLYSLILSSKLPTAKKFKHWVTSEVLPSIRKTGGYSVQKYPQLPQGLIVAPAIQDMNITAELPEKSFGLNKPMALSKAPATAEKAHNLDLSDIKTLLPAANYEVGNLTASKIAEIVGLNSARAVNKTLVELGLITKSQSGNGYDLTEEGKAFGEVMPYTAPNGHSGYRVLWNEKVIPLFSD